MLLSRRNTNRFKILLTLIFFFCVSYASAQKFRVVATTNYMCGCFQYQLSNMKATMGGKTQTTNHTFVSVCGGTGNVVIFDQTFDSFVAPVLSITADALCPSCAPSSCPTCSGTVTEAKTFDMTGNSACKNQTFQYNLTCSVSSTFVVTIVWTPIYSPLSNQAVNANATTVCEDKNLTLSTVNAYSSYKWEYSENGGTGPDKTFAIGPGTSSSVTFGIDEIYGASYQDKFDQPIVFRASLGSCPKISTTPIRFYPKAPTVTSSTPAMPTCKDGTDGSVQITSLNRNILSGEVLEVSVFDPAEPVIGGNPIAQLTNVTSLPVDIPNLPPGNYKFYVYSNKYPCGDLANPATTAFTVPNRPAVVFTPTPTNALCNGGTGSIAVAASGGTGTGYQYSKDNGVTYQASNVFTNLSAGTYPVIVKDGNNCAALKQDVIISQPAAINTTAAVTSDYKGEDISCVGSTNGQITITASGGAGTLTYSKEGTTYQASNIFAGLAAGTYNQLKVKDANGCIQSSSIVVIAPPPVLSASASSTDATCSGFSDGIVTLTASGGTGVKQYSLDNGTSFQPGNTFSRAAGTYSYRVKDENGCLTTSANVTINQPAAIGIATVNTKVNCFGDDDGSVEITTTNAALPVSYTLSGPMINQTKLLNQTSALFNSIPASSYTITIIDGNGCSVTGNTTVISNPILKGTFLNKAVSCFGGNNGEINLTPSGGTGGPYTISWSSGQATEDLSNLTKGTYTVTITDSNVPTCSVMVNTTVTEPTALAATSSLSDYNGVNVSCATSTNGAITLSPSGGTPGTPAYTYVWSNGATTKDVSNLASGNYSVQIKDGNGCILTRNITLSAPTVVNVSTSAVQDVLCFGQSTGSIALTSSGGVSGYQYSINNGSTWQPGNTFNNIAAGTYNVVTKDANNCQKGTSVTINQPIAAVSASETVTNTTCGQLNGSIKATSAGGTGAHTFQWFDAGNSLLGTGSQLNNLGAGVYKLVVKDQNGCTFSKNITLSSTNGPTVTTTSTVVTCPGGNDGTAKVDITGGAAPYVVQWPGGETANQITGLSAGDYIVKVTDSTPCEIFKVVTVTAPGDIIIQTTQQQQPTCFGDDDGAITVQATFGNGGPYTYQWNEGPGTATINNLSAGSYQVTVKDQKSCSTSTTITLIDPPQFTITLGEDRSICEGQEITLGIEVGNATYVWSGPDNFESTSALVNVSTTGTYSVAVTDAKGCTAQDQITINTSNDLLKADLLMVSQAFAGDTLIAIDISWPMPESIEWFIDPAANTYYKGQDYTTFSFAEPGIYVVRVKARLAQCVSNYTQTVEILERPAENGRGDMHQGVFVEFEAFPNPFDGKLTITSKLREPLDASIILIHLGSNKVMFNQKIEATDSFERNYELSNYTAGIYVLVVKAGGETKSIKLLKK